MLKSNIYIEKASKKSKKIISQMFNFTILHIEVFLISLFFLTIIFWGYIFYQYTYKAQKEDPEVSITSMKIKEPQLKEVVEDIKKREEKRLLIYEESNIKNIFEEKKKDLTEESSAQNIPAPRFR